jgi:hypothetical protein
VSNFLRSNRFRCRFFIISLSFALHKLQHRGNGIYDTVRLTRFLLSTKINSLESETNIFHKETFLSVLFTEVIRNEKHCIELCICISKTIGSIGSKINNLAALTVVIVIYEPSAGRRCSLIHESVFFYSTSDEGASAFN